MLHHFDVGANLRRRNIASHAYLGTLGNPSLRPLIEDRLTDDHISQVFLFDDRVLNSLYCIPLTPLIILIEFDEGHLRDDPIAAQEEVDATMAIMTSDEPLIQPDEYPVRYLFQSCWQRVKRRASPGKCPN